MVTLPPEIYDHIFAHACTDGGRTGAALARVSRQIAAVSERTRYQSVVLIGSRAMLSFATLSQRHVLEREKPLPVRYLYIADHDDNESDPTHEPNALWYDSPYWAHRRAADVPKTWLAWVTAKLFTRGTDYGSLREAHVHGVNAALVDILSTCAPCVRVLTMNLTTPPPFVLVPVDLPMLESLAILTGWFRTVEEGAQAAEAALPGHLPSLRRLDLLCFPFDEWSPRAFARMFGYVPALTHLRLGLSELNTPPDMPEFLPSILPEGISRVELHQEEITAVEATIGLWEDSRTYIVRNGPWLPEQHATFYFPRSAHKRQAYSYA